VPIIVSMATASRLRPLYQPPEGCGCDLCRDDEPQAVPARPAPVRPVAALPARQVLPTEDSPEARRLAIERAQALVFESLIVY
jgi:hypothetical protein